MLAINDQIFAASNDRPEAPQIRIGLPGDLSGPILPWTIAKFRKRWPDFSYHSRSGAAADLMRELRRGEVDIVIALSREPPVDARHSWTDPLVWVRSGATNIDKDGPVPMLAFSWECMCYRSGIAALTAVGREAKLVMTATTVLTLSAAVDAGLGTMVMSRSRVRFTQLERWEDGPLPPLPKLHIGIHVRDGADNGPLLDLADELMPNLRPKPDGTLSEDGEIRALRLAFEKAQSAGRPSRNN
jgi:DNA-binding transcriptional LysR family regulator